MPRPPQPGPSAILRPVAILGILLAACITFADVDLWGHLRFGLDILEHGQVRSAIDPYSFTQDRPFLYHEWLGGVAMAAAYRVGGTSGLILLKAALAAAIFLLVWGVLRRARFSWRWAGMSLTAFGVLPLLVTLRPQLWSVIGVILVCRTLTIASPPIWALPVVFLLWANLHGGWILGGGLLLMATGIAWLQGLPQRRRLLIAGCLSLLATLVTPYGFQLWRFLFETIRLSRDDIAEWQPIWRTGVVASLLWFLPVSAILVSLRRRLEHSVTTCSLVVVLGVAAALVTRLGPMFTVASVVLLAAVWPQEEPNGERQPIGFLVFEMAAVGALIVAGFVSGAISTCVALAPRGIPPIVDTIAGESLRGRSGRLVTAFNWGEYALWHFGPALKVSIDGRRETVYSDGTIREAVAITFGGSDPAPALTRLNPDYVWLPFTPASQRTREWLVTHGYREDIRTARSFVARRESLPPLAAWNGSTSGCFPGP